MIIEEFETGSGGFVWQNQQPDTLLSQVQFHIYAAFDMQIGEQWKGNQFVNHYNRIYYVESGRATLQFAEHELIMEPGYLYLIPPYQLLSHSAETTLSFKWVHFQASLDSGVDLFMIYGQPKRVRCESPEQISTVFDSLIRAMQSRKPSAIFERQGLLLLLMAPLKSIFDEGPKRRNQLLHPALLTSLSLINKNVTSPPSLTQLAAAANMSPEHFSRKFKAAFTLSPKRYMLHKRIGLAKQRLLLTNDSVEKVAEDCGFADIFHFSRTFKKEVGVTASAFRKEYDLRQLASGKDKN